MDEKMDASRTYESSEVSVGTERRDAQNWSCATRVSKLTVPRGLRGRDTSDMHMLHQLALNGHRSVDGVTIGEMENAVLSAYDIEPEIVEVVGNLLMYGGASCQWQTLIGNGTTTADQALTYYSNARAAIGVGDSTTAAVATTNNLVAATNKLRVAMDATFPQHTDGVVVGSASIVFRGTFATGQANWPWQEWGVFNSTTDAAGRMLQRKVESLGTKTSVQTYQIGVTLSIA